MDPHNWGFPTSNTAEAYLPQSSTQMQQQQGHGQRRMPFSQPLHKLSDTAITPEPTYCEVEGCGKDIRQEKDYYQRYRICEEHLKLGSLLKDGVPQRFCQQCGRFHLVSEFDGDKRSCRARLSLHNNRRRKRGGIAAVVEDSQPARGRRSKARSIAHGGRQPTQTGSESGRAEAPDADAVAKVHSIRSAHPDRINSEVKGLDSGHQTLGGGAAGGGQEPPEAAPPVSSKQLGYRSVVSGSVEPLLGGNNSLLAISAPEAVPAATLGQPPGPSQHESINPGFQLAAGRGASSLRQDCRSLSDPAALLALGGLNDVDWNDLAALNQQGLHPSLLALDPTLRQHFGVAHSIHIPHSNVGIPSPFSPGPQGYAQRPSYDADAELQQQKYQQMQRHFQQQQQLTGQQGQFQQQGPMSYQQLSPQQQQMLAQQQWTVQDKFAAMSSQPISLGTGYLDTESGSSKAVSSLQRWSSEERHGWFRPSVGSAAPISTLSARDTLNNQGMSFDQAVALDRRPTFNDIFQSRSEATKPRSNESSFPVPGGPYGPSGLSGSRGGGFASASANEFSGMSSGYDTLPAGGSTFGRGSSAAFSQPSGAEAQQPPRAPLHFDRSDRDPGAPPGGYIRKPPLFGGALEGGAGTYAPTSQLPAGGPIATSLHLSLQPDTNRDSIISGASRGDGLPLLPSLLQQERYAQYLGEQEPPMDAWRGQAFDRVVDVQSTARRSTPESSAAREIPGIAGQAAPDASNIAARSGHAFATGSSDPSAQGTGAQGGSTNKTAALSPGTFHQFQRD